ncbi:MAG: thermopsin [Sulfolobaceae archaeon]|nr:thermopsin [Sulfolobaceae archaeon]
MRRKLGVIITIAFLLLLLPFITITSGYVHSYYVVLPHNYYVAFKVNVNDGHIYVIYFSNASITLMIMNPSQFEAFEEGLSHSSLYSIISSNYFGAINVSERGEYYVVFYNNVSLSPSALRLFVGTTNVAPVGIADYGLKIVKGKVVPYIEKFNTVVGVAKILSISAYNSSPPKGVSPYGASLQLNVVLQVNTKTSSQQYWLQNIVVFNASNDVYYYLDNIWNLTENVSVLTNITGNGKVNGTEGQYYYAYGTSYYHYTLPFTVYLITSITNVTPNSVKISFGYINGSEFFEEPYFYDNVTIFIPNVTSAYLLVDGYNSTGGEFAYDAELVFGGMMSKEITDFTNTEAILYMFYFYNSSIIVPKALFPYGVNTAEASENLSTTPFMGAYEVRSSLSPSFQLNSSYPFNFSVIKYYGFNNASVVFMVSGGVPPYILSYIIYNGSKGEVLEGQKLLPNIGTYSLTLSISQLKNGNYTLVLKLVDAVNNSKVYENRLIIQRLSVFYYLPYFIAFLLFIIAVVVIVMLIRRR